MNLEQRQQIAKMLRDTGFLTAMSTELGEGYYDDWRQHIDQRERIGMAHDLLDDLVKQVLYYADYGKVSDSTGGS